MRGSWLWLMVAAVGCGGKGGSDTGTAGTGGTTPGGNIIIDCNAIPQFVVDDLTTCAQLANSLETVTDGATDCNVDADCQPVHPGCQDWPEARCYYAANTCVTSALVSSYNTRSQSLNCGTIGGLTTEGCVCYDPPPMTCDNHVCRCDPESACQY